MCRLCRRRGTRSRRRRGSGGCGSGVAGGVAAGGGGAAGRQVRRRHRGDCPAEGADTGVLWLGALQLGAAAQLAFCAKPALLRRQAPPAINLPDGMGRRTATAPACRAPSRSRACSHRPRARRCGGAVRICNVPGGRAGWRPRRPRAPGVSDSPTADLSPRAHRAARGRCASGARTPSWPSRARRRPSSTSAMRTWRARSARPRRVIPAPHAACDRCTGSATELRVK